MFLFFSLLNHASNKVEKVSKIQRSIEKNHFTEISQDLSRYRSEYNFVTLKLHKIIM